jgi:hypothetical protein
MAETIIVIAIVAVVLALAGRSLHRTVAGKNKAQCCGCDSCASACGDVKKSD